METIQSCSLENSTIESLIISAAPDISSPLFRLIGYNMTANHIIIDGAGDVKTVPLDLLL